MTGITDASKSTVINIFSLPSLGSSTSVGALSFSLDTNSTYQCWLEKFFRSSF